MPNEKTQAQRVKGIKKERKLWLPKQMPWSRTVVGSDLLYFFKVYVLVRILQRNRANRICIHREKFILMNWLTELWRLARPKFIGWAVRLENQWRANGVQVQRGHLVAEFLLIWERSALFSTQGLKREDETHSHYGEHSALPKSHQFKCNLI